MGAKVTRVTLVAGSLTREFELSHAERLLAMPNNGGWKLPEDSKYEFVDYGIRRRADKKETDGK